MTVTSNATGASVEITTGAAVVAQGTISENGSYTTPVKLAPGTYTVTVSKIGFKEVRKTIIVDKDIIEAINLEEIPSVDNAVSAIDNVKVYIDKALQVTSKDDVVIDGKPAKEITVRKDGSVIATAAENLTPGSKYEVKVFGSTYSIVAKPADSVALKLVSAEALSCTVVKVELDGEDGDDLSVLDPANYAFDNGLKAVSVEYDKTTDGNFNKSIALVTTTMQTDGQAYNLKVDGITDFAGNASKDTNATFAGIGEDKTAPEVFSAVSVKGNTVEVTFKDASKLEDATLNNTTNYFIDGLKIEKVLKVSNNILGRDKEKVVTLLTDTQTPAKIYTLKVGNIADVYGNKMTKTAEVQFTGTKLDTEPPVVEGAEAETNTTVLVKFDDSLDAVTAENAANYKIPGLTISKAKLIVDYTDPLDIFNSKHVELTTSSQVAGTVYKVTVSGVKDAAGNVITTNKNEAEFAGVAVDTVKPGIESVTSKDKNKIEVKFDEKVDVETAKNPLNYEIDGGLGYATAARVDADKRVVTLTTATQEAGKVYNLTVNSVKDLSGNVIATASKASFIGLGDVSKYVELASAVALNNKQVQVTFNKDISTDLTEFDGSTKNYFEVTNNNENNKFETIKKVSKVNNKTYILTMADKFDSDVYTIRIGKDKNNSNLTAINDFASASINDKGSKITFGGIKADPLSIGITSVTQISTKVLRVTFNQKVKISSEITATLSWKEGDTPKSSTGSIVKQDEKGVDSVDVTFNNASDIPSKKSATLGIAKAALANIKDAATQEFPMQCASDKTSYDVNFGTGEFKESKLEMTHAQAVDSHTIDVEYNSEIKVNPKTLASAYEIQLDGKKAIEVASAEKTGDNKVRIYLEKNSGENNTNLVSGKVYYVTTKTSGIVTTLDDVENDDTTKLQAKFAASSVNHEAAKLISAQVNGANHVQVVFSEAVKVNTTSDASNFKLYYGNDLSKEFTSPFSAIKCIDADNNGAVYMLTLAKDVFVKDVKYAVALSDSATFTDAKGIQKVEVSKDTTSEASKESTRIKVGFGGTETSVAVSDGITASQTGNKLQVNTGDYTITEFRIADTPAAARTAKATTVDDGKGSGKGSAVVVPVADRFTGSTTARKYVVVTFISTLGNKFNLEYVVEGSNSQVSKVFPIADEINESACTASAVDNKMQISAPANATNVKYTVKGQSEQETNDVSNGEKINISCGASAGNTTVANDSIVKVVFENDKDSVTKYFKVTVSGDDNKVTAVVNSTEDDFNAA